jgi:hypothetical protein
VVLLVSTLGRCIGSARGADAGQPRFIAPTNQQELDGRVAELRRHYGPFLRSLPPPLPARERTALPKEWKFTFEAKLAPKKEGVPPAPAWFGADFDDSPWETTVVTGETVDLSASVAKHPAFDLLLTVADAEGQLLSRYQRTVRAVPIELQE